MSYSGGLDLAFLLLNVADKPRVARALLAPGADNLDRAGDDRGQGHAVGPLVRPERGEQDGQQGREADGYKAEPLLAVAGSQPVPADTGRVHCSEVERVEVLGIAEVVMLQRQPQLQRTAQHNSDGSDNQAGDQGDQSPR